MKALFNNVDCIRLYVPDLIKGLEFYRDNLGSKLVWKKENAIGLLMNDGVTELVIQNKDKFQETDIKVDSVDDSVKQLVTAGGKLIKGPFDIAIGKCAVVEDPWGNRMVILDSSKGTYITDKEGNILGQNKLKN